MSKTKEKITSDGIQFTGGGEYQYSFSSIDDIATTITMPDSLSVEGIDIDIDIDDKELRAKYPALQDAWDHYSNVKHMCEQKEKEDENR